MFRLALLMSLLSIILFTLFVSSAVALSLPFDFKFPWSSDDETALLLDIKTAALQSGDQLNYTVQLKNQGNDVLEDLSISDNFGQIGFQDRLASGGTLSFRRTTPPIESDLNLKVIAKAKGTWICQKESLILVSSAPLRERIKTDATTSFDEPMKIMSAAKVETSSKLELNATISTGKVHTGDAATITTIVTNRGTQTLRRVTITASGWRISAGDLKPGESKTYSKGQRVTEDLSLNIKAEGVTDDGNIVSDLATVTATAINPAIKFTVVSGAGDGETGFEYILENSGNDILRRLTLKDEDGNILGILTQLNPGETQSLVGEGSKGRGTVTVTCMDSVGDAVTCKSSLGDESSLGRGLTRSDIFSMSPFFSSSSDFTRKTTTAASSVESGAGSEAESETGFVSETQSRSETETEPAESYKTEQSDETELKTEDRLKDDDKFKFERDDFNFESNDFSEFSRTRETRSVSSTTGSDSTASKSGTSRKGSEDEDDNSKLVATLQVNRTVLYSGEFVRYRCTAENTGVKILRDARIECGRNANTTRTLLPGDCLVIEGTITAKETMTLVAIASATKLGGDALADRKEVQIRAISPGLDLKASASSQKICSGQEVLIKADVKNAGNDLLTDITITDAFGEIGTIESLKPGETRTLQRRLVLDKSLSEEIFATVKDATGHDLTRSERIDVLVFDPKLEVSAKPKDVIAYPDEIIEIIWTVKNAGELDLENVSFVRDGSDRYRLPKIGKGQSFDISATYRPERCEEFLGTAKVHLPNGEAILASSKVQIKTISPQINLNVDPSSIEISGKREIDLECIVSNLGDDPLVDVTLSEAGSSIFEHLGTLKPGESKTIEYKFSVEEDQILKFKAAGKDSLGKAWSKDATSEVKHLFAAIDLFAQANPALARPGDLVDVTVTVENQGFAPLTDISVAGKSLGQLGTMDDLAPGSSQSATFQIEVSSETDDLITVEGFTKGGISVKESCKLHVGLIEIPDEDAIKMTGDFEDRQGALGDQGDLAKAEIGTVPVERDGEIRENTENAPDVIKSQEGGKTDSTYAYRKEVYSTSGISSLMEHLREMLESIRLRNSGSYETKTPSKVEDETLPIPTEPSLASPKSPTMPRPSLNSVDKASYRLEPVELEEASSGLDAIDPTSDTLIRPTVTPKPPAAETLRPPEDPTSIQPAYSQSDDDDGITGYQYLRTDPGSPLVSVSGEVRSAQPIEFADPKSLYVKAPSDNPRMRTTSGRMTMGFDDMISVRPMSNTKLTIESLNALEIDKPPQIIDVAAFPPEPSEGEPVVMSIHASDDRGVYSINLIWGIARTKVPSDNMLDVDSTNYLQMAIEEGDPTDGYWSSEIPGQTAGTYMSILIRVSDGVRWSEDGPYLLYWSEPIAKDTPPDSSPKQSKMVEPKGETANMCYIESTTVVGKGDVSINNVFRESSINFREDLAGSGSIEMESKKEVKKGNPTVNFTDSRNLVFGEGQIKGFKKMESPAFHGGMGASITERFDTCTLQKSEIGTIKSLNNSANNVLSFDTQQAFEGIWGTKTEYSKFSKKIKTDQKMNGTFETQKKITFED